MGKPSIGELDPSLNETQAEKLGKLTVLKESSKETIYNLIFSVPENKDNEKKRVRKQSKSFSNIFMQ